MAKFGYPGMNHGPAGHSLVETFAETTINHLVNPLESSLCLQAYPKTVGIPWHTIIPLGILAAWRLCWTSPGEFLMLQVPPNIHSGLPHCFIWFSLVFPRDPPQKPITLRILISGTLNCSASLDLGRCDYPTAGHCHNSLASLTRRRYYQV